MNDAELDTLLAHARKETPADAGAADRFLAWHRAEQAGTALPSPAPRSRARWWPALLGAAVLTGALVLRPAPDLPASAAYDAYQGALGEGW
ncbi:hypothetical protein Dcar01_02950 [Deinococcus carri]|uniref:Uncharacterized protein n=1 Tax=Deinococcus carri TaxID=1211323 RepID=A0ABP9WAN3_9DEIO